MIRNSSVSDSLFQVKILAEFLGAVAQVDTNQTKSLSAGIIFRVDPDNYKFYSNYLGADGSYSMPGTNGSHLHKCIFTNASSQMQKSGSYPQLPHSLTLKA
jgi:hypothetical protein